MTVRSTVSQVPHPPSVDTPQHAPSLTPPQLEPQELAPHGSQLEAQGAEQQELTLLPKQLPACAEAVIKTAAASDKT